MQLAAVVQKLPRNPALITRLYLQRLERQGVTSTKKLSALHWETIQRMEQAAAVVKAEMKAAGEDLPSRLARVTQ